MSEETKKQLKKMSDKVLEAINTDAVVMRSRYYFMARSALWILGVVLAFGLTLYLISFAAFVFRGNGLHLLPSLGAGGWLNLFISLPWILLLVVFVVFVLLQILSTHFSFVYKRPLVHSILTSIFILVIGGVAIGQTQLHDRAYELSQERRLPIAGPLYRDAIRDRGDVHIGVVENLTETGFTLATRDGERYTVKTTDATRTPPNGVAEGAMVLVVGAEEGSTIEAHGIRPFAGDARKPPFPKGPPRDSQNRFGPPPPVR